MTAFGVFAGLTVLDLSWGISGQMATMHLGDQGARVIRVEPPEGAPFADQPGAKVWNRGKQRMQLDFGDPADLAVFQSLVSRADVVVETFSPGTTARLGIDDARLRLLNPRLIYCSITAYGEGNEHSDRPGYEALVAARTGVQWAQRGGIMAPAELGQPDVEVPDCALHELRQDGPLFSASPWMSINGFYQASIAIAAALVTRERTGLGQRVETSMLARVAGLSSSRPADDGTPIRGSWMMLRGAPKGLFECADGRWVHHWALRPMTILQAAEHDSLDNAPKSSTGARRDDPNRIGMETEAIIELFHWLPLLQAAFKKFPAEDWARWAARVNEGVQVVRSPEEALADPLSFEDGCVVKVADPDIGPIRHLGLLADFSVTPGRVQGPTARLGEHTDAIRAEAATPVSSSPPTAGAARAAAAAGGAGRLPPLHGVTVLDLGVALAGPYASSLLADLGADVIKVNAPWDGWWLATGIGQMANMGKRSIVLNLQNPQGKEVLYEMVRRADIVTHNMRWGVAERLGIGYEDLEEHNPSIIYCQSRGFDRVRSAQNLPGTDQMGSALGGQEWEDGGCGRGGRPLFGTSMGDLGNGFLLAISAIQALYHRDRTGVGQAVGTSIVNACLATSSNALITEDGRGVDRARLDALQLGFHSLYRLYETADGWICIAAVTDEHWWRLCAAVDLAALQEDSGFSTAEGRKADDVRLGELLGAVLRSKSAAAWLQIFDDHGVPAEISSPQFNRPDRGEPIFRFSETPARAPGRTPELGEHTREILHGLGMDPARIDELCASGVAMDAADGAITGAR